VFGPTDFGERQLSLRLTRSAALDDAAAVYLTRVARRRAIRVCRGARQQRVGLGLGAHVVPAVRAALRATQRRDLDRESGARRLRLALVHSAQVRNVTWGASRVVTDRKPTVLEQAPELHQVRRSVQSSLAGSARRQSTDFDAVVRADSLRLG